MRNNQKGFTIIELMFAVGIIGVLAAVAIPVYLDYSSRAKVAEGFALADRAKTGVTETYLMDEWKQTNSEYGLADPEQMSGTYVKSVSAVDNIITITYNGNIGSRVPDGSTAELVGVPATGSVKWTCRSNNIKTKFLPASCR